MGVLAVGSTLGVAVGLAACADHELHVTQSSAAGSQRDDARSGSIADLGPPLGADGNGNAGAHRATTTTTRPPAPSTTSTTRPPPSTTAPPTTAPVDQTPEQRSLAFVNQKRAENGLAALRTDPDLTRIAEAWAQELVRRQDLVHNPNLSDQVPDRFHAWGENIAYSSSAGNIDEMWWESDGHRANILGSQYTSIGIAFVRDSQGITWAVQDFGG